MRGCTFGTPEAKTSKGKDNRAGADPMKALIEVVLEHGLTDTATNPGCQQTLLQLIAGRAKAQRKSSKKAQWKNLTAGILLSSVRYSSVIRFR